jgi:transcriptional antiterminator
MGKKEIRQDKLLQLILTDCRIPKNLEKLAESLGVSVRTLERDINDIRALLPQECLHDMKEQALLQLRHRISNMKDSDLIRLVEFFVPKKRDVQVSGETQVVVKLWNWSEAERNDRGDKPS